VVTAMAKVAREAFVPAESRQLAYRDTAVALANGRSLNLPLATGKLLTEAYLLPTDNGAADRRCGRLCRRSAGRVGHVGGRSRVTGSRRTTPAARLPGWAMSPWSKGRFEHGMPRARPMMC